MYVSSTVYNFEDRKIVITLQNCNNLTFSESHNRYLSDTERFSSFFRALYLKSNTEDSSSLCSLLSPSSFFLLDFSIWPLSFPPPLPVAAVSIIRLITSSADSSTVMMVVVVSRLDRISADPSLRIFASWDLH